MNLNVVSSQRPEVGSELAREGDLRGDHGHPGTPFSAGRARDACSFSPSARCRAPHAAQTL
eukprot:6208732-Pleurochrysis_carterae.AAC.1